MRFATSFSLLLTALTAAPFALAFPVGAEGTDLEVRGIDFDSDFVARAELEDDLLARDFYDEELLARAFDDDEVTLLARAVLNALDARNDDPPHYSKHDPNNGPKPKYTVKDPNPPPKYRQKDHNPPGGHAAQRPKPRDVEAFWERNDDPPHYSKHDPNNGPKPKYAVKDPNPPPKYRQKDHNPSGGHAAQRPKPRDLAELDVMWTRNDDPPAYSKHDPINGAKPKYTVKDPNPPPKYRQKDHNPPGGHPAQRPKPREVSDLFWW